MLTVIEPAETQDLVTLESVKASLGIGDETQDAIFQALIIRASAMIARYCNRVFLQETVAQTFQINHYQRTAVLLLKRIPIASINSVSECGNELDQSCYLVEKEIGSVDRLHGNRPSHWRGTSVVTYIGGYEQDNVPADIQGAAIDLVSFLKQRSTRDLSVQSVEIPGVMTTRYQATDPNGIPDFIAAVLDEHVEPNGISN